jgi:hypothetical protein
MLKYEAVRTWRKDLSISSSKYQLSRLMDSLIGALVKDNNTSELVAIFTQNERRAES